MELLFLWIEDFRNIKKQGFDFSPELKFEVTPIENKDNNIPISYHLKIHYNEQYVDLFDGNIINVTGIIGKNGSGKSSLLHCLKMMSGKLSVLLSPLIFCVREKESNTIKTYYYSDGGDEVMKPLSVIVDADKRVSTKYKMQKATPYIVNRFGIDGSKVKGLDFDFSDIACCYFSNTFDSHRENIYEGIYNISTNYRLETFLKEYIESKGKEAQRKKNDVPKIELWPSHMQQFHKIELKGLVRFLSYAQTRRTGQLALLPKTLIVEFKFDDFEYLVTEGHNNFLFDRKHIEDIQKVALDCINKSNDKRKNFLNIIILTTFYYVLRKGLFEPTIVSMDETVRQINDLVSMPEKFFENLRKIMTPLSKLKDKSIESRTIKEFLGKSFENAINRIEFSDTEEVSENKIHYRLKIENSLWTVFSLIFDLQALEDSSYMDYSWDGGLSTGQEAFLYHFARLNELKTKLGYKTIWLLIDEGDLYFHPEWQKKYFSELLGYVKFLFPRNKVQIIITTHSPFIASDLPKQNLIFLKQDVDSLCKVANNEIQRETFGSNIHDLFTNSFFLEDGLMGEFARTNITNLINEINSLDRINLVEYQLKYKNRIEIIGESFLHAKIHELIASKSDNITIDAIIEHRDLVTDNLRKYRKTDSHD